MKKIMEKEYLRRTRKVLETKHYSENLLKMINTWALLRVNYSGPFLKWTMYKVHTISFHTFFVWAFLLIVHTWNSSPLRSTLLRLQCTCCIVPTTSARLHGSPLVWACQWPSSQPLSSPQLSHKDSLFGSLWKSSTGLVDVAMRKIKQKQNNIDWYIKLHFVMRWDF